MGWDLLEQRVAAWGGCTQGDLDRAVPLIALRRASTATAALFAGSSANARAAAPSSPASVAAAARLAPAGYRPSVKYLLPGR